MEQKTKEKNIVNNKVKEKVIKQKNNGLFAVGGVSVLNMLVLLFPTFLFLLSMIKYCSIIPKPQFALTYYYIPHLLVVVAFGVAFLIMTIGGFARSNVMCLLATILFGLNFVVARVTDYFTHLIVNADYLRFSDNPWETIGEALKLGLREHSFYYKQACLPGVVFLAIGMCFAAILLLMKCAKARGIVAKVIGIIIAVISALTLGISSIADMLALNAVPMGLSEIPYIEVFFRSFGHFFEQPQIVQGLLYLEPMFFIILDMQILIVFLIIVISSAITIPSGTKAKEQV